MFVNAICPTAASGLEKWRSCANRTRETRPMRRESQWNVRRGLLTSCGICRSRSRVLNRPHDSSANRGRARRQRRGGKEPGNQQQPPVAPGSRSTPDRQAAMPKSITRSEHHQQNGTSNAITVPAKEHDPPAVGRIRLGRLAACDGNPNSVANGRTRPRNSAQTRPALPREYIVGNRNIGKSNSPQTA
jgi:hypothetical protein